MSIRIAHPDPAAPAVGRTGRSLRRSALAAGLGLCLAALLQVLFAPSAGADASPVADGQTSSVSADALPTVQINGVVWDQEIVGDTVYAVGEFTRARPAGAAPGTNETVRNNILAYDVRTGQLITSFAPSLNAAARSVTASPDGSRIYVGGSFTQVSGVTRNRIVALNPTTGAVITAFNASLDYRVNAISATNSTVYVGGQFNSAGPGLSTARTRLAAFTASTGAVVPGWAPSANAEVHAIVVSPDQSRVFVGGKFTQISGVDASGLAATNATTGAVIPWTPNTLIKNGGPSSAILSLSTDGTSIFGTGYKYGQNTGNFEGAFSANPNTGKMNWLQDCHGDTYGGTPMNGLFYTVSHAHYCGNVNGFPQSDPWTTNMRHSMAFTDQATGTVRRDPWSYFNWQGQPSPSVVNWFPEWQVGSYTGQNQAAWTIAANEQYLVAGGEFTRVNNQAQQGLVRFAARNIAPNDSGPRLSAASFPLNVQSTSSGRVRVSFPANWDRDSLNLTYRIQRNGTTVHTRTVASTFWNRQSIGFTDTGLTPGASVAYRVTVTDPDGNQAASDTVNVTVAGSGQVSPYADEVMADGPRIHWRFGDAAGATSAAPAVANERGTKGSAVTFGAAGAMTNESNTAASFSNNANSLVYGPTKVDTPEDFTIEAWIRTSTTSGGRIVGMTNSTTGSDTARDRILFMSNNGRVNFTTTYNGRQVIQSPTALNNNQWHHIVGTVGDSGMRLYVDGVQVAVRTDVVGGGAYQGYWRVGAGSLSGVPNRPSTDNFSGQIDEVAVYYYNALPASRVAAHYNASGRGSVPVPNQPPTASFTASTSLLTANVNASGSGDGDGTITNYAWNFGDGSTGSGVTASRTYAAPGTYTVTLTVTDDDGATNTTTRQVTVNAAPTNSPPTASFTTQASGLAVSVNGSGSGDSDGSITGYAWNFGDGATATGATASRTYAAAGTYTITLTVTDDDGATGTTTRQVTVGNAVLLAGDSFERTTTNGWGAANAGGTWSLSGSLADFAVNGAAGRMTLPSAGVSRAATLGSVSVADVESVVDLSLGKAPTGGGTSVSTVVRKVGNSEYRLRVQLKPTSTNVQLQRVVGGVESTIVNQTLSGVVYSPGTPIHLRLRATGSGTTALAGKVWFGAAAEPAAWTIQANDTSAGLQGPGGVGVHAYISGSSTEAPNVLSVDNLVVAAAQG